MSNIPQNLKYTKTHEWVRKESDGTVTVGITDHAQSMLGDFVFIDLPKIDTDYQPGKECCVVESVKAASDVYMPIAGKVKAVNTELAATPGSVNSDPYGKGWLFQITPANANDVDKLLDAVAYAAVEQCESH